MFPSLFLWRETYRNMQSDTPWEKLKKSLLMVLQILTVIALIIALMSPYIRSKRTNAGHVIIVMDNSASMKTKYSGTETRLEAAIRDAVDYVEKLLPGTSISLIESNKDAVLLLSDTSDKSLAIKKLKAIEATNYAGSCEAGASMVHSMTAQWESSQVICYTDTPLSSSYSDTSCIVADVYNYSENAFIEYVGHGRNADGTLTILAKIMNDMGNELKCDANLYGDGKIIAVSEPLNIPAKSSSIVYYENVSFDGSTVCVELNGISDALPEDDRCYDIVSEISDCEVLLLTERNLYLEKAVGLIDGVKVTKSSDSASFTVLTANKSYDLYIFDGIKPDPLPETGNMIFINSFDDTYCPAEKVLPGTVLHTVDSKVTVYMSDYRFGVSGATAISCPYWAEPFLSTTIDGNTYIVGTYGSYNGRTVCAMGFDLHETDLPLKLEFPVLIYNIMNYCSGTGMLQANVLNAGSTVRINAGRETASVKAPSGKNTDITLTSNFSDTGELGIYNVSRTLEGKAETEYFAVNFPKSESTAIRTADTTSHETVTVDAKAAGTLSLRNIIIIIILVLLAGEWIIYLRGL